MGTYSDDIFYRTAGDEELDRRDYGKETTTMSDTTQTTKTGHVEISTPGLMDRIIPITADSTVEIVYRKGEGRYGQDAYALLVDGRHYELVLAKHTIGRPERMTQLDWALALVKRRIADLQPQEQERNERGAELDEAEAEYRAAEAAYNALDARCVALRKAEPGSVEAWQAYGEACRQRREAFQRVEAAWDRWVEAKERAA